MTKIEKIRKAFADYVATEGCSCCRDDGPHQVAQEELGKLLGAKKYKDGSGYDFKPFRSPQA